MKRTLLILTLLTCLCGFAWSQGEPAVLRIMCPPRWAMQNIQFYVDIDNAPVCEPKFGYYYDIVLPTGRYDLKVRATNTMDPAALDKQLMGQMNMLVREGTLYFIDLTAFGPKVLNEKKYNEVNKKTPMLSGGSIRIGGQAPQPEVAENTPKTKPERVLSDVDEHIPSTSHSADDTYVLIIANEEYMFIDNVPFASYDGETFRQYCIQTLGVPEKQVRFYPNATYGMINGGVDWLRYALNNFDGSRAIIYYCGHGIPDEKTGEAYIVPVDGNGTNTTTCYSLNTLYKTLSATRAASLTYFMDACFTGANREGSMLVAARGVAREAKRETISGNTVVFSASSGDETAMTFADKQHGLFTYYLLKKIQQTKGEVSYGELAEYIIKNVKKDAFLLNEKPQTPVVATSPKAADTWRTMRLVNK